MGILAGAALLSIGGAIFKRQSEIRRAEVAAHKRLQVRSIPAAPDASVTTPAPSLAQISAGLLRVTAISLGHPRLAVINGRQVGEGDFLAVPVPAASVTIKLKVLKIGDGRIELSDGIQIITAWLAPPELERKPVDPAPGSVE